MLKSEGSYYHIYNRGNNKELIFFEEANYVFFLKQFKHYMQASTTVFAYCLMPNHFHCFIQVNDVEAFEKGIKNFFISYSKAINKRYNRVGSLFQGRYKVKEILSDSYYTRIVTYIHQNPMVAGLVSNMEDYQFSSYSAFLSGKDTLLKRNEVLEWFGGVKGFLEAHAIIENGF